MSSRADGPHRAGPSRDASDSSGGRTGAEWATLVISVVILLGVIGAVIFLSGSGHDRAPIITVEPLFEELRLDQSGHVLPIRIRNQGDLTARDVVIGAVLEIPGLPPEDAELTVDYLAGDEATEASFIFTRPPTRETLTLRAKNFLHP